MDNLKLPAYPVSVSINDEVLRTSFDIEGGAGFNKIEKAALMMVPVVATYKSFLEMTNQQVAENAVDLAKAILDECNK